MLGWVGVGWGGGILQKLMINGEERGCFDRQCLRTTSFETDMNRRPNSGEGIYNVMVVVIA